MDAIPECHLPHQCGVEGSSSSSWATYTTDHARCESLYISLLIENKQLIKYFSLIDNDLATSDFLYATQSCMNKNNASLHRKGTKFSTFCITIFSE